MDDNELEQPRAREGARDRTNALSGGFFAAPDPDRSADELHRELQTRYRHLVDHLPAVVYIDGVAEGAPMVDVSAGVRELFGVEPREWVEGYLAWERSIHPDDRERIVAASERSVRTGDPFRVEYRVIRPDGRLVWVREDAILIHDEAGVPLYWLGTMLDITQLITAQEGLRDARSRYGALVEQIPAIVYVDRADDSMITTYVSPQIEQILGVSPQEYLDDPNLWTDLLHSDDRERALQTYTRGRDSGEPFSYEYRLVARDGRIVWFQDSALVLHDTDGRATSVHGVMLDITERKEAEERLSFLAYHDSLTGLPNSAMFDELLERALARARRSNRGVAVLALDVDNFKLVNDSLGHRAGDQLIRKVAERLDAATRDTDVVARQGGDEFLLLIADIDRDESGRDGAERVAETVVDRIRAGLEEPFEVESTELYVTVSIGISVFPQDAPNAGALLRNADAAMFRAKRAGPGAFALHRSEGVDALSRLSLSTRLRKAVEQKVWALHYQPLVNLITGDMVGVEALIRWPDPTGGLVLPGEFIPLAEEMGLIESIGDWVVEEVCRQDAAWRAEGLELEIGFNLSPRELWQVDPVERVADHLAASGMDPTRVTVEITESAAMNEPDRIIEILCRFRDRGIKLAIDDFGTGYSSLARLRYMPVDVLKIDRTFVREVNSDPQSASMVSAIIALASNLGMRPLAEGIETEAEWRFLADRGCEHGQGFFFSKPLPADEVLALHRRQGLTLVEGGLAG